MLDWDGVYGGQCVDLYRYYADEVLGFPQSCPVGGAADIWHTADPKYYNFIDNDPYAVPKRGDIVIWNRNVGGGYGHVAIFLEGDVNSFNSLDQNWPTWNEVTITFHNYNNIIGWLRPKEGIIMPEKMEILVSDFNRMHAGSSSYDKTVRYLEIKTDDPTLTPFEKVKSVIAGFKSRATLASQLEEEVKNRKEQVSRLEDQLSKETKLRKDLNIKLNQAVENYNGVQGVYEERIQELQAQVDSEAKQKGECKLALAKCKAGEPAKPSLYQVLVDLLKKFVKWAKNIKLGGEQGE